jgi:hypothetical protein
MTDENYNKLWKIRTVFDEAKAKYYGPTEHLAVNEIIMLVKGIVIFKQYVAKKHNNFVFLRGIHTTCHCM